MKKLLLTLLIITALLFTGFSQGAWTQRANTMNGQRCHSVGFVIGNYGYFAGGVSTIDVNDTWQYDPVTDVWTQKADYPGVSCRSGIGFTIGNKAYVGLGAYGGGPYTYYNNLYEYDPLTNIWTQKAPFPGNGRIDAYAFSVNNKGYVGGGGATVQSDLWQYDPITNTWIQKSNPPFTPRTSAASFVIGNIAYVGTGQNTSGVNMRDMWEYNYSNDTWKQDADFGGSIRYHAVTFSLGNYGYLGTGLNSGSFKTDFWKYNVASNSWSQIPSLPAAGRCDAFGFTINNKGYVGTGWDGITSTSFLDDFWVFDPSLGLEDNLSGSIGNYTIFPNPHSDKVTIEILIPYDNDIISIYSLDGQLLIEQSMKQTKNEMDISSLTKGLYVIKLSNAGSIAVEKFIKE